MKPRAATRNGPSISSSEASSCLKAAPPANSSAPLPCPTWPRDGPPPTLPATDVVGQRAQGILPGRMRLPDVVQVAGHDGRYERPRPGSRPRGRPSSAAAWSLTCSLCSSSDCQPRGAVRRLGRRAAIAARASSGVSSTGQSGTGPGAAWSKPASPGRSRRRRRQRAAGRTAAAMSPSVTRSHSPAAWSKRHTGRLRGERRGGADRHAAAVLGRAGTAPPGRARPRRPVSTAPTPPRRPGPPGRARSGRCPHRPQARCRRAQAMRPGRARRPRAVPAPGTGRASRSSPVTRHRLRAGRARRTPRPRRASLGTPALSAWCGHGRRQPPHFGIP